MLGNYLGYLPIQNYINQKAFAADTIAVEAEIDKNKAKNNLGLIAILVEKDLMDDQALKSRVMTYAKNAQKRIPHSKSFVLEVDKNESTIKIASVLEKLYFEGVDTDLIDLNPLNNNSKKEDNNRLIGVVLIGDVPMPVVHENDGIANLSVYPYVDFYRKQYIYNHKSNKFEFNSQVSTPNPEVWHGLIVPPSKDSHSAKQELIEYFDKNNSYSENKDGFADFEQRMLYANFPEMEKQMNYLDYKNYGRYTDYMEEMVMNRYNKHLLKEVISEVSTDMGSDTPIMPNETIDTLMDVHTEPILKKYAVNFAEALRIYHSGINNAVEKTGRWSSGEVDSPESLITIRDEYGKYQIKRKQLMLERDVNEAIKNNIPIGKRRLQTISQVKLKVKLKILNISTDENTFTFDSYIDGKLVSSMTSPNQCGIQVGQRRPSNKSVLKNNSILVNANRMFNPETVINKANYEDTEEYKLYGGCVLNNSLEDPTIYGDPSKCITKAARAPIFDVIGSIEVPYNIPNITDEERCSINNMSFNLPIDDVNHQINQFNIPSIDQYDVKAAEGFFSGITVDKNLGQVISDINNELGGANDADISVKTANVIKTLMDSREPYSYEPYSNVEITISVVPVIRSMDSFFPHVEPTTTTISSIKHLDQRRVDPITGILNMPSIITPSIPADGIRYISFLKDRINTEFDYMNLFRLEGDNPRQVKDDIEEKINNKQQELNSITGTSTNIFKDFFNKNSEILEPLIWKEMSIDQKLKEIIPKYTDRDSFMPSPNNSPKRSPQNKPNGYEVLHIVADGDVLGYQFGLNRAMIAQAPDATEENNNLDEIITNESNLEITNNSSSSGSTNNDNDYICGDPSGVEIWEWFDSLQCWIEEEILPAEGLFSLSNACSSIDLSTNEEEEEAEDIFSELLVTPTKYNTEMKQKSLVVGQEHKIKISALNKFDEPILGYIDMPVHFKLDNADIGEFSDNDVYIFTGEKEITFTAKKTGTTKLTITMGNLDPTVLNISVFDHIDIDWKDTEKIINGRSQFTINIELKDPNGNPIRNVNDEIILGPEQPADGGFENEGKVELVHGKATIKFSPTPGKNAINLISKDKYITTNHVIHPTSPGATQIILRAPAYIPIGEEEEIEVIAADPFGYPVSDFTENITIALNEESKDYATLKNPIVNITNGKGILKIASGKETTDISMIAQHPDLKIAKLTMPLLARVDSEEWENTYPQTLFGSFIGFPAGDFTQENYFGGTHLFAGKTQAVYSFLNAPKPEAILTIEPNHLITLKKLSQTVLVEFPGNQLLLQAFDRENMQTLLSKKVDLNFDSVEELNKKNLETGKMYVEILDTTYSIVNHQNGLQIRNTSGKIIADMQPNKISINDSSFKWIYESQPEFNMIELHLTDGLVTPIRILLNLKAETLKIDDFVEINPNLNWNKIFGDNSINDKTGLYFFNRNTKVTKENRAEFYGFEESNKYLALFASGTNIGEAIKFNMPSSAILLGDPTIKLKTRSNSSLNFNNATGQQIFQDPEGSQIASINHFNFNNDGIQDIALLMKDGRVRLLEGGVTEPPYIDRGDIAALADGGIALEPFDLKDDNYEDLIIATDEGRLAILHNDKEVITRTDQKLNIGKKIYKLLKADMNQDGYDDLIIHDSRGDIYIFYYDSINQSFPESGKWIANYGYSLKSDEYTPTEIDIRYAEIPEPQTITTNILSNSSASLEGYEIGGTIDNNTALAYIEELQKDTTDTKENPKLPWPEDDEIQTYFAPIEDINSLAIKKSVVNKDRNGASNVDLEETLTYTIEIDSNRTFNDVVLADTVLDSLTFMPDSVTCIQGGCQNIKAKQNSIRIFFSELKFTPGQKTIISYDVFVANTPESGILIKKIDEPNENLTNPNSIIDQYLDILVSPPYNNTGRLLNHYSTSEKTYALIQDNAPKSPATDETGNAYAEIMAQMQELQNSDGPPENLRLPGVGDALEDKTCFEDPESSVTCAEGMLDDLANAMSNFNCGGAGCFPTPYNYAFLAPPQSPLPILAFPATLPGTPPIPMVSTLLTPLPGAAAIPGPINSTFRMYLSPTLTGGLGISMCWGLYPQSPIIPPPVFPIPYPPPIGNCMVTAINPLPDSVCREAEDAMTYLVDQMSAGVNKINSVANDITNNPNLPISIQPSGSNEGVGGIEIGLGVNLGNSMKFDPPAKAFSNIHIKSMDSIGGVISGWLDRQVLEIQNKLLTLPTFSVYFPDFKSLFTLDLEKTEKRYTQWENTMLGTWDTNVEAYEKKQKLRESEQDLSGSKAIDWMSTAENIASTYNLSSIEGLYDVVSTMPLVKLTEKPIQFNIPWLSAAEIQAYITEMQDWVIYYEREYARVKDKWEKYECIFDDNEIEQKQLSKEDIEYNTCAANKIAEAFGANFEEILESVKKNIEVLQAWLNFPKELIKFKLQLADYIRSVACYLDVLANMMGGYMATIQQQMISWAELILTISEIIKNIDELFDVFTSFDASCDTCTNERFTNFGWFSMLGLVLPDIPIIQFPKIPDIVLDMSNINAKIDIELPILELRTTPLPLPPLPYISLPDLPTINLLLSLPPLPILPGPPELPNLPELPPLPVIDLPTLPPPPKLPDVGQSFELIIPLIEKILRIWCLMKKSLVPVPEMALNDQITLLTNRPAYLIPLDIMDVSLPNVALFDVGFNEIRIETIIYLGLRINTISKPLEEASDTWNRWIQSIPDTMNEFYQERIIKIEKEAQEWLDEQEQKAANATANLEEIVNEDLQGVIDRNVQGWLDRNVGDPLEEADKWLRDREATWQEWADTQGIAWTFEEYNKAIIHAQDVIIRFNADKRKSIDNFFDKNRDFIHGINVIIPLAPVFEYANELGLGDETQDILDFIGNKLNEFTSLGPTVIQRLFSCVRYWGDCKENEQRYFEGVNNNKQSSVLNNTSQEPIKIAQKLSTQTLIEDQNAQAIKMLATPQGQQMKGAINEINHVINNINKNELVDYTVLKERFNVPDYKFAPRTTTVDKLHRLGEKLTKHSNELLAEAQKQKNVKDLYALAGMPPLNPLPYKLASNKLSTKTEAKTYTNAIDSPKILAQAIGNPLLQNVQIELPERKGEINLQNTNEDLIPVIPYINFSATSETLFMPSGHLVYSDGTGLYLKRDLTVSDDDQNTDTRNPARFTLNNSFMKRIGMQAEPKEAINMLKTTFTENGAATFTWTPTSNPDIYGYGIELERTLTGYDVNKQNSKLADTKIILLPPNEEGLTPNVLVNGNPISSGTLVTSLTDAETASTLFGVSPQNIITGASQVDFPTISNVAINVDANTAVYFDILSGSAYSMSMENGFHHIKMTWFNDKAETATYNQSELLSPQIYAGSADPLDISQTDTYYTPIYKEKTINASDIFVDLSGAYNYYWFIDPDNNQLTPQVGNSLTLAPQKEEKTIKVKLIATQNIEDDSFDSFEKIFSVKVYVPGIKLNKDSLDEGIIAGTLIPIHDAPDDDLSEIPFSIFRKRFGTWKNIGMLNEEKYYSVDSAGDYYIENLNFDDPSAIELKDNNSDEKANVNPGGKINLLDEKYKLKAVPGSTNTPTHIAIISKDTEAILGNVYYIADTSNNITIINGGLTKSNISSSGVTVGDTNTNDDIIAVNIPNDAPSFPGGVAIFNETPPQVNVALIDTDGTIRMMQDGYDLELKNLPNTNDRYIFRIISQNGNPIFDTFIQADFDNLEIDSETRMDNLTKQIGFNGKADTLYAQSTPNDVKVSENPFPDLDASHPYFKQILDLYKARVISGYEDGSFKPDQKLTRAEFIKIALGVTNCFDCTEPTTPQKEKYNTNPFPDTYLPSWYFYCISIAKELKMITGYGDGLFRPEQNISRAEAVAVLIRQSDIELSEAPEEFFKDVPDYAWYVDYVYTAVEIGLIKNSFGFVSPDEQITRGEFAFMAAGVKDLRECRLVDEDKDGVPDWWEMTHDMDPLVPDLFRACPCYDNPNQDDTDGDGTRDVCDLDIDNDGILNPLCIFDDNGKLDPTLILKGSTTLGEPVDNCIFVENTDQADLNTNGIGNLCEPTLANCTCLDNPNKNDTDNDGIPDVCDDDIDNDSILNPICIFDDNGLLDKNKILDNSDNCIFIPNADQKDGDLNAIGNACEEIDLCPSIPEDLDGVDDEDGCPEINDEFQEKDTGIYVGSGTECSFIDYKNDGYKGDTFMTAITDILTQETLYSKSAEVNYK